jgi:hypothetical protein
LRDVDRARQPAVSVESNHDVDANGGRSRPATNDDEWGSCAASRRMR